MKICQSTTENLIFLAVFKDQVQSSKLAFKTSEQGQ